VLAVAACGGADPARSPGVAADATAKIAFVSGSFRDADIYLVNADGSGRTRLTRTALVEGSPSWSADGARIAFQGCRAGSDPDGDVDPRTCELYVMDADGTAVTRLTENTASEGEPEWSPDGGRIAFVGCVTSDFRTCEIEVMDADGTNRARLTDNRAVEWSPTWSPDGSKIAFVRLHGNSHADELEIHVMNADGSDEVRLTENEFQDSSPSWSPDGRTIAFETNRDKHGHCPWHDCTYNNELYVMNPDGSGARRVTESPADDGGPAWSPDGTQLVFARQRGEDDSDLFVASVDGTCAKPLVEDDAWSTGGAAWQPAPDGWTAPALEC
jgi:Tol biopolymer transport system component